MNRKVILKVARDLFEGGMPEAGSVLVFDAVNNQEGEILRLLTGGEQSVSTISRHLDRPYNHAWELCRELSEDGLVTVSETRPKVVRLNYELKEGVNEPEAG